MTSSPLLTLLAACVAAYLFRAWWIDYRSSLRGSPNAAALPGATPVDRTWIMVGVFGALLLVGVETAGEYALDVVAEQSTVSAFALLGFVAAGFYEELIFRGFIYYDRGTRLLRNLSIVAASLLFALLHYDYYTNSLEGGGWELSLDAKSVWSLLLLFLNSLWFYYLRFSARNPERSLLPCFAAHIVSNVGVFVVKAAQGFVTSWI